MERYGLGGGGDDDDDDKEEDDKDEVDSCGAQSRRRTLAVLPHARTGKAWPFHATCRLGSIGTILLH